MKMFRIFLFALAITSILTEETGKLFDLNEMYEQGKLKAFLALGDEGYPVTVSDCLENPILKITQKIVNPPSIINCFDAKI